MDYYGPLFRPRRGNHWAQELRLHLHPDEIDSILRKYTQRIGLGRGYSAHSMQSTFITTVLNKRACLEAWRTSSGWEGMQPPSTTKISDRRGCNLEKVVCFCELPVQVCI